MMLNDAETTKAMTIASAFDELLQGEPLEIQGAALAVSIGKWLAQFPREKRDAATDKVLNIIRTVSGRDAK
jgi:hypothetical protein